MKTEIKPIGKFHTLICTIDNDDKVAAIVLPSNLEGNSSASRCRVNFINGCLEIPSCTQVTICNDNMPISYITDATVMEMDDCLFRVAAANNAAILNRCSFNMHKTDSFADEIMHWMDCLPSGITKCRLFGGDILSEDMLENIFWACRCRPSMLFFAHTSRVDILNNMSAHTDLNPDNAYIYARSSCQCDEIPLHNYPVMQIGTTSTGNLDLESFPKSKNDKDFSIRLGEDNETRLRTRRPWCSL